MRELGYAVEGKVANLRTFALDEPGHGGACHDYHITRSKAGSNGYSGKDVLGQISFQNGPINADGNGVNGVQNEDLLAIVIDRLEGFQSGKYACNENDLALRLCRMALDMLQHRTRVRIRRGVEGTHAV